MKYILLTYWFFLIVFLNKQGNAQVTNPVIMVTQAGDYDPFTWNPNTPPPSNVQGTLRWAITVANNTPGSDEIRFSDNHHIQLLNASLPIITEEVFINGTNHTSYNFPSNTVSIIGNKNFAYFGLFVFNSNNVKIKGVSFANFGQSGVGAIFSDNLEVSYCIFTDMDSPKAFISPGITSVSCSNSMISNNIFGDINQITNLDASYLSYDFYIEFLPGVSIGGPSLNNVLYNNTTYNTSFSGLIMGEFSNNTFTKMENNLFYNPIQAVRILNVFGTPNNSKPTPNINYAFTSGLVDGSAQPNDVIDIYGASQNQNAEELLGTVSADVNGHWSFDYGAIIPYSHVSVQARDRLNNNLPNLENSSELRTTALTNCLPTGCQNIIEIWDNFDLINDCVGCPSMNGAIVYFLIHIPTDNYSITLTSNPSFNGTIYPFSYGVAQASTDPDLTPCNVSQNLLFSNTNVTSETIIFPTAGDYYLGLTDLADCPDISIELDNSTCESCIGSFAPIPGREYLVGAWAKEAQAAPTKTSYTDPKIKIQFTLNTNGVASTSAPIFLSPSGAIIDGWQRIEEKIQIPSNAIDITIELTSSGGDVFFDDIRMFPFDGSMKSFVYDPINMRLEAELDERHYATFYEYDEEGKLVRIKKETERGVMTIQETKSNSSK